MIKLQNSTLIRYCIGLLMMSLVCISASVNNVFAEELQRDKVEKRLQLAENYLNSNTAKKIDDSGNDEAKQFLTKAKQYLEQAQKDLTAGNLEQSIENADQSIRAFTAAGAVNSKSKKNEEQISSENNSIRTEIDAYLESFKTALAEKGPAMAGLLDQKQVDDLLAHADKSQAAGDHTGATSSLNQAKQLVVVALTKIRSNETVVYTHEFQTPADEYRYERERYEEYVTLSQKVLSSVELDQSKKLMFDKLQEKSDQFNQHAIELASKGDYESAITQMEEALKKLVQGLQLLGMPLSM